jgi:spoIIIJ-associated protein
VDYADEVILAGIKGMEYAKPVGSVTEEGLDTALTALTDGLLARSGFPGQCETTPGEYRQIKVTTDDESAGMLIGRHGQTIDAVEHLVERMASNAIDARARINLDINDYRQRREEGLAERVREAAATIRETGRSVHLEPMSPRERRLVHMEAAGIEGLRTFTMDRAGSKHVVIAPDTGGSDQGDTGDDQADDEDQGNNY